MRDSTMLRAHDLANDMSWSDTLRRLLTQEQRYEPNPLQRAALSALLISSISGSVVLILAMGRWFDDSTPSWMLLLGSVPMALVATLMATSHEEKLSASRLAGPALVSLGVTLSLGVGIGLLWREDGVRQQIVKVASEHELSPVLVGAMQSGGPELGALACQELAGSTREELRQEALKGLLRHPEHFSACLLDSSLRDEWGKQLVDGWMGSMRSATRPDDICAWSDTLSEATREVPGASMALMSCALDDTTPTHQTCCLDAMRRGDWVGDRIATRLDEARPNAVYERAMSVALSAQLAGSAQQDIGMQDSEPLKRYGYAAVCRSMNLEQQDLASGLASLAIDRCQIREKSLRQDTSFWVSVCTDLSINAALRQDVPVETLFCRETRWRMVARATHQASQLLHVATLTPQTQELRKLEQLAGIINTAAIKSGFVPSDSTGIVSAYEDSRYSRSASNQALHKLGERRFEKSHKMVKNKESAESKRAFERALDEAPEGQHSAPQHQRIREAQYKAMMGNDP